MSVLAIRSHKRFAVRRPISLHGEDSKRRGGLMIELSSEGCRISNAESGAFMADQPVTLDLGDERLEGHIRWTHGGVVGVKFARARYARWNWANCSRQAAPRLWTSAATAPDFQAQPPAASCGASSPISS